MTQAEASRSPVARTQSLYIHPIKSCKGTSVQEATYTHDGLCESGAVLRYESSR